MTWCFSLSILTWRNPHQTLTSDPRLHVLWRTQLVFGGLWLIFHHQPHSHPVSVNLVLVELPTITMSGCPESWRTHQTVHQPDTRLFFTYTDWTFNLLLYRQVLHMFKSALNLVFSSQVAQVKPNSRLAHPWAGFHANPLTRGPCKSSAAITLWEGRAVCQWGWRQDNWQWVMESGRVGLRQISPAITHSIICVILTLQQKHDPV